MKEIYLIIIPRARMGSKSIAHEAEVGMGARYDSELGHEDERNNCFNLVKSTEPVYVAGQKYRGNTTLAS